jgi:Sec7-like guanine-nucleotide exchange factor
LPGEAQMIDRIMSRFATRFAQCNTKLALSSDVCYVLAFSLIMLNTDAHNNNIPVERKMSKDQFVNNLRGVDNGADIPRDYLERLYDKIVSTPFARDYERDEFAQWDKQGFINMLLLPTKFKGTRSVKAQNLHDVNYNSTNVL